MKEITRKVFEAFDGKVFDNKNECEAYEKKHQISHCWNLIYGPDLTEGRGYSQSLRIGVTKSADPWSNGELPCLHIATLLCGGPVAFVQGCSAMPNYRLTKIDVEEFAEWPAASMGDYTYKGGKLLLNFAIGDQTQKEDIISKITKP